MKQIPILFSIAIGREGRVRRTYLLCAALRTGFVLLFALIGYSHVDAQEQDTIAPGFIVDFEVRPRAEYFSHYTTDSLQAADPHVLVDQRNRLTMTYARRRFRVHGALQEIQVWGESGRGAAVGSVNAYELYLETKISKRLGFKLGRQSLSLDNGRIFSAAPWAQQSRAHEGLRLMYRNQEQLDTDLTIAFTRPYSKRFDKSYSPVASHQYKLLLLHHLKYKPGNGCTLTSINVMDAFDDTGGPGYHFRFTNGGRWEYGRNGYGATVAGYYQYGRTADSKKIQAYYLQPELSFKWSAVTMRLGMEILSGDREGIPDNVTRSFVPLYGVAWKFMGNMNLFTRFPSDVNNKGLVNPYFFFLYSFGEKLSVRADGHLFYSQYPLAAGGSGYLNRYLGFETDLSLSLAPVKDVEVNFGLSFLASEKSMEVLKKVRNADKIAIWSYLMISYSPRLFQSK